MKTFNKEKVDWLKQPKFFVKQGYVFGKKTYFVVKNHSFFVRIFVFEKKMT